jgi:hypothetical protein
VRLRLQYADLHRFTTAHHYQHHTSRVLLQDRRSAEEQRKTGFGNVRITLSEPRTLYELETTSTFVDEHPTQIQSPTRTKTRIINPDHQNPTSKPSFSSNRIVKKSSLPEKSNAQQQTPSPAAPPHAKAYSPQRLSTPSRRSEVRVTTFLAKYVKCVKPYPGSAGMYRVI